MTEGERQPWERRLNQHGHPLETRKAFAGFVAYRDMGPDRSLAKLSQQTGKHVTQYHEWSARHSWQARVDAWDAWLDQEKVKTQHREVIEMGEQHARAAVALRARALQTLQTLQAGDIDARTMTYMIDTAVKIERLARGQPSERIELTHQLLTPLVSQLSLIFLEVNIIEDPDIRAQEFAARADQAVNLIAQQWMGKAS